MLIGKLVFPVLWILAGSVVFYGGCRYNARIDDLLERGIKVKGEIRSITKIDHRKNGAHQSFTYDVTVLFFEANGSGHQQSVSVPERLLESSIVGGDRFEIGRPIEVVYDPLDPTLFRAAGDTDYGALGTSCYAVGGLMILLAFIWLNSAYRKISAQDVSGKTGKWQGSYR